jgi:hypothetical protein
MDATTEDTVTTILTSHIEDIRILTARWISVCRVELQPYAVAALD